MSCKQTTNPKSEIRNPKSNTAFTMMELMMAIGIFAVGMSLVAALFPAAIKETENTVKDYEGPTICENGLAIVKAKVTHTAANTPVGVSLGVLTGAIVIGDDDREFRTYDSNDSGTDNRERGFIALAKQWAAGRNDYQVVIIAYDIAIGNDIDASLIIVGVIAEDAVQFTYTGDKTGLIGSPAIDSGSGRYATIVGVDGDTIHLNHSIGENVAIGDDLFVIREHDGSDFIDTSPVIQILMTRTALRD